MAQIQRVPASISRVDRIDRAPMLSALQDFSVCAAQVAPDLTVIASNAGFDDSVQSGEGGLALHAGVLTATFEDDAEELRSCVVGACAGSGGVAVLARINCHKELYVRAKPLEPDLEVGRSCLLLFGDPVRARARLAPLLRTKFSLSAAEIKIACALGHGVEPAEIAVERGVALSTIRSQVASLMRKTDTQRQAQLVAMMARLEAALV